MYKTHHGGFRCNSVTSMLNFSAQIDALRILLAVYVHVLRRAYTRFGVQKKARTDQGPMRRNSPLNCTNVMTLPVPSNARLNHLHGHVGRRLFNTQQQPPHGSRHARRPTTKVRAFLTTGDTYLGAHSHGDTCRNILAAFDTCKTGGNLTLTWTRH